MKILQILTSILGIGKDALNNKAELKRLKAKQEHSIVEAQTKAQVDRILSNTDSDNQIDLITAQDKKHSLKEMCLTGLLSEGPRFYVNHKQSTNSSDDFSAML